MHDDGPYPVTLVIDYPDRQLDKLTSFFRPFTVIPIAMVLALLSGGGSTYYMGGGGVLFAATVLMLLFRRKYPRWWFDWNLALVRFSVRVSAYLCLLRDEYPSTDEEQAVHIEIQYPDASKLSSGMPLVKWILAIPHYIVLSILWVAAAFCVIVAWFSILFTGRYPRGLFDFVVGVFRWHLRVAAYAFLLVTDDYPPFSME
ncbi:MAG: DUF4389 domain-containing protein [Bacteroidetes bacterium]|nr:DUF4389 domain-containing protein [Bacteroidota bacterium]